MSNQRQIKVAQREAAAQALTADAISRADRNAGLARIGAQVKAAYDSPAGKFATVAGNAIAPTEVENAVGGLLRTGTSGAARMRELVKSVSADPDALAGLRKAGVDWIVRTHLAAGDAGASGEKQIRGAKLISFLKDNRDVLRELYTPEQMNMLGAVTRSIETDSKWIAATAAKNGPGTAKDTAPKLMESAKATAKHTSMAMVAMEGFDKGWEQGGWAGVGIAAAAPALYLMNNLRTAGIRRVDDLYQDMMIDPNLAKAMLAKMPDTTDSPKWYPLVGTLRKALILGPLEQRDKHPPP